MKPRGRDGEKVKERRKRKRKKSAAKVPCLQLALEWVALQAAQRVALSPSFQGQNSEPLTTSTHFTIHSLYISKDSGSNVNSKSLFLLITNGPNDIHSTGRGAVKNRGTELPWSFLSRDVCALFGASPGFSAANPREWIGLRNSPQFPLSFFA